MNRSTVTKHLKTFFSITTGIIIFTVLIYIGGIDNLNQIKQVRFIPIILSILTTCVMFFCVAIRWRMIVVAINKGSTIGLFSYFHFFSITSSLSQFLPKEFVDLGGRTLWLRKKEGMTTFNAGFSVIWDRFMDFYAIAILLAGTLPYWFEKSFSTETSCMILFLSPFVGALFLVYINIFFTQIILLLTKLLKFAHNNLPWLKLGIHELPSTPGIETKTLIRLYIISILKSIALAFTNILFAEALNLPIPNILLFMGTPASQLFFFFSISPGGLGFLEAGWFSVLLFKGILKDDISLFLIGQRLFTIITVLIVCFLSFMLSFLAKRRANY